MNSKFVMIPAGVIALFACDGSESKFAGSSKRLARTTYTTNAEGNAAPSAPAPTPVVVPTAGAETTYSETPEVNVGGDAYSGGFEVSVPAKSSLSAGAVWAVTGHHKYAQQSAVYRIELDEARGYPMWRKTIPYNYGNRTYVSEIGLLVGRSERALPSGGGIFVAGPQYSEGVAAVFTKADLSTEERKTLWMRTESRMCVTSYRLPDGTKYVGGAYVSADKRKRFVKIPIDSTKPNGVDISKKKIVDLGSMSSGDDMGAYSCFTDQKSLKFWFEARGFRTGVNLNTDTALSANDVPNATASYSANGLTLSPRSHYLRDASDNYLYLTKPDGTFALDAAGNKQQMSANYAIGGDAHGNIASFYGASFSTHESVSDYIFSSRGSLKILHASCISSAPADIAKCAELTGAKREFYSWPLTNLSDGQGVVFSLAFTALSSLNDGRLVAVRNVTTKAAVENVPETTLAKEPAEGYSELWLVMPKDLGDLSKGPVLKKIAQLSEVAYMYNDFTGATLYAAKSERTVSLSTVAGFKPGVNVSAAKFVWKAESGTAESWRGLTLKMRCYLQSAATKPAYFDFVPGEANSEKDLPASCSGNFDSVDLLLDGNGDNNFSRTAQFVIRAKQIRE